MKEILQYIAASPSAEHGGFHENTIAAAKWALQEIADLQQWVNDCQSGMFVNCVYCGHRYGPREDTPVAMADVLRQHIEQCPKHPLSAAKAEIDRLRAAVCELEELVSATESERNERGREIERLHGELAKCRRLLREVCRDPERVEVDGVRCWEIITTDELMQAAQAAGGEG